MLIFLHIPKTGGSTLNPLIDWNYNKQTHGISLHRNIQQFIDWPDDKKRQIKALKGQIFYGIHNYIPEPCTYITFLRHPVQRLVSQYFYNDIRKERLGEKPSNMSIEGFLEYEPFQAYMQLNLIAGGTTIDDALRQPLTDDTFARAKANIEQDFAVVGLVEHYDESLLMMKRALGWQRAFYARSNVNERKQSFDTLPQSTQKVIQRACEPELELFYYAQKRLQAQLDAQPADFWDELAALKRTNQRFARLYQWAHPLQNTPLWTMMKRMVRAAQSG